MALALKHRRTVFFLKISDPPQNRCMIYAKQPRRGADRTSVYNCQDKFKVDQLYLCINR